MITGSIASHATVYLSKCDEHTPVIYYPHMEKRKSAKRPNATLDKILTTVERGFAAADRKFTALAEDIADVKTELTQRQYRSAR